MKLLHLSAALLIAACTSQGNSKKVDIIPNPMLSMWSKVGDQIELLESKNATQREWKSASESEVLIKSSEQLAELIERSRLEPKVKSDILQGYNPNRLTAHYGFDADYHALVFFDKVQKSTRVFKW